MIWATADNLRTITGDSTLSYTDGELTEYVVLAQREVNAKLAKKVIREPIQYIDQVRKNEINGVNTTFYLKNWKGNYLGDLNYDGEVDILDIEIYSVDKVTNTESKLTPSSIGVSNCSFVMSSAPSNVDLYITYSFLPLNPNSPDALLAQIVTFLAASYLYVGESANNLRFGNVAISGQEGGQYSQYYQKYLGLMAQLEQNISDGGAIWGESLIKI